MTQWLYKKSTKLYEGQRGKDSECTTVNLVCSKSKALAGVARFVEALSWTLKSHGFNSQSGHIPRLRVQSWSGCNVGGNPSIFFPPPLSPHFPLIINMSLDEDYIKKEQNRERDSRQSKSKEIKNKMAIIWYPERSHMTGCREQGRITWRCRDSKGHFRKSLDCHAKVFMLKTSF